MTYKLAQQGLCDHLHKCLEEQTGLSSLVYKSGSAELLLSSLTYVL